MNWFNPSANQDDDLDRYQLREEQTYIYMYDEEEAPADELEVISI